jgi:hypothetical protein
VNTEKQVTSVRYWVIDAMKGDAIMGRQQPPHVLERALEGAETCAIVVGDDNSDDNLEIPEGSKLGNDGCLNLPKFWRRLAVPKG